MYNLVTTIDSIGLLWKNVHGIIDEMKDVRNELVNLSNEVQELKVPSSAAQSNYVVGDDDKITGGYDPFLQAIYQFSTPKEHPASKKKRLEKN